MAAPSSARSRISDGATPRLAVDARRTSAARESAALVSYVYGALLVVGGVLGNRNSASTTSLVAGLTAGTFVCALERAWYAAEPRRYTRARAVISGCEVAISLGLTYVMGMRWALTQRVMPAGFVAAVSAAITMVYGQRFLKSIGI